MATLFGGQDVVDALGERAAGFRAVAAGMHADLFGEADHAQARHVARGADGEERFEQIEGAVLDAQRAGDARGTCS